MKPLRIFASLLVLGGLTVESAIATTKTLPRGPDPKVLKTVDDHLFHVYVTPPKKTDEYVPGDIVIMLQKKYPDYLYVSLMYEKLENGALRAQIAISPEQVADYTINVLDRQPDGEFLMLYSKPLEEIERVEKKRAEQGVAVQPAAAVDSKSE